MRIARGLWLALAMSACTQASGSGAGGGAGGSSGAGGGSGGTGGGSTSSGGGSQDGGTVFPLGSGKTTALPAALTLRGVVIDDETGKPVSGALIASASATVTSTSNGAFELQGAPGRLKLTVSGSGRVTRVVEAVLMPAAAPLRVRLVAVQQVLNIDGAAHSLALGDATLEVAAGSFLSSGALSATWSGKKAAARVPGGPRFFRLADGSLMRITGKLSVTTGLSPAAPLRLTVPTRGAPAQARLFALLGDGTWEQPGLAPVATGSGTASFDVPHFSEWGEGEGCGDYASEPAVVTEVSGSADIESPGAAPAPAEAGDDLQPGAALITRGDDVSATIDSPAGKETTVAGDAQSATYEVSQAGDQAAIVQSCRADPDCSTRAIFRSTRDDPPAKRIKFIIRTRTSTMGDRGTVASMVSGGCTNDPNIQLLRVAVAEGSVDVHSDTDAVVTQGNHFAVCVGCKNPDQTGCCDATTGCDGGCCNLLSSTCAKGDQAFACGKTGAACGDCTVQGLGCFPQGCAACGTIGQPCCPSPKLADGGVPPPYCLPAGGRAISFCSDAGTCSACGVTDAPCCSPDILPGTGCINDPIQPRTCVPGTTSLCDNCGGRNQRCCQGACYGIYKCGAVQAGFCN